MQYAPEHSHSENIDENKNMLKMHFVHLPHSSSQFFPLLIIFNNSPLPFLNNFLLMNQ